MATTSPARIDDGLYAAAKLVGSLQSRSASQQVAHWARIGRELEASASISPREIAEVLAASRSYDTLGPREQAMVRAEWSVRMDARREALDLAARFSVQGRSWVELDDQGNVVRHDPVAGDAVPGPAPPTRQRRAGTSSTPAKAAKAVKTGKAGRTRRRAS